MPCVPLLLRMSLIVVAALGLLVSPGAASPVHAQGAPDSITIKLLEAAVERADDPRARIYINDHLAPGETITRRVQVSNTTGEPQRLDFYAAAADVASGSFAIRDGRGANDLTRWTTVEPGSAVVPDGGSQVLTVTVRVPSDASDGERYAAVLAEKPAAAPQPGTVSTGARVGIRMYLSVGEGEEPTSDFTITTLQAGRLESGQPVVTAEVDNTGGRALDLGGSLALTEGPGGLSAGPFPAELGTTLAPGDSSPVTVLLDKAIQGGPWLATLKLRSGQLEKAAEATITFPDEAGAAADPVAAEEVPLAQDLNVLIPIAIGLILLIALLLLLLLWRRRKKKSDDEEQPEAAPAVPVG